MNDVEKLILDQLAELNKQMTEVRTQDIPNIKTDVALLVRDAKTASKWHTTVGSFIAVVVSMVLGRYH